MCTQLEVFDLLTVYNLVYYVLAQEFKSRNFGTKALLSTSRCKIPLMIWLRYSLASCEELKFSMN